MKEVGRVLFALDFPNFVKCVRLDEMLLMYGIGCGSCSDESSADSVISVFHILAIVISQLLCLLVNYTQK